MRAKAVRAFPVILCLWGLIGSTTAWPTPQLKLSPWLERMDLSGDLRLRQDRISRQDERTRIRHRYRLRLDGLAQVDEDIKIGLRLASGESRHPVNSNETTFTDGFANKDIYVDMAYLEWRLAETTDLQVGKIPLPFYSAGRRHLLWDPDITPEGVNLSWNQPLPRGKALARLGTFVMQEYVSESDSYLYAAQAAFSYSWLNSSVLIGAGAYYFSQLKGRPLMYHRDFGNSVDPLDPLDPDSAKIFRFNYEVLQAFLEWSWHGRLPTQIVLEWTENQAAPEQNRNFLVALILGEQRRAGDVSLSYDYRFMEKDSQVGALTDGWFAFAQQDSRGHNLNLSYAWRHHSLWTVRYLVAQTEVSTGAPKDFHRFLLDLRTRF